MVDTGEQGMNPDDPAKRAGIGGGVVPDDLSEGYEQAAELAEHPGDSASTSTSSSGAEAADGEDA